MFRVFFLFLVGVAAHAAPPTTAALVRWTLHGDAHIQDAAKETHALILANPGIFGDVGSRDTEIPRDGSPADFAAGVATALASLRNTPNPRLILSIRSHGGRERVYRDGELGHYELAELVDALRKELDRHRLPDGKPVPVDILYDACFSGSLVNTIEKTMPKGKEPHHAISIVTSAPDNALSHGGEFPRAMTKAIAQLGRIQSPETFLPGLSPFEKVGMLTAGFITSSFDQPLTWSYHRPLEWDLTSVHLAANAAPSSHVISRRLVGTIPTLAAQRTGALATYSGFLRRIGEKTEKTPPAIVALDVVPDAELAARIEGVLRDPQTSLHDGLLVATWASHLSPGLVDKSQLATWEAAFRARITATNKPIAYDYHRARTQAQALVAIKDAAGLFQLFRSVPRYDERGHRGNESLTFERAFVDLVVQERLDTPENIRALEQLTEDGSRLGHAASLFWEFSSHARLTDQIIEHFYEDRRIPELIQRFQKDPAAMRHLLSRVAIIDHGDRARRDLASQLAYYAATATDAPVRGYAAQCLAGLGGL